MPTRLVKNVELKRIINIYRPKLLCDCLLDVNCRPTFNHSLEASSSSSPASSIWYFEMLFAILCSSCLIHYTRAHIQVEVVSEVDSNKFHFRSFLRIYATATDFHTSF